MFSNWVFFAVNDQNNGNCSILKKDLSAVPGPKDDTKVAGKVGFSAVPKAKNGNFKILNGGFSAVPEQNNRNVSISKKELSPYPYQKRYEPCRQKSVFRCTNNKKR